MSMRCSLLSEFFICVFFFFKQKTAYEMRISDWSSDVCSSDLTFVPALLAARSIGHHDLQVRGANFVLAPLVWREYLRAVSRSSARSLLRHFRSEERRVGKECVSTCRSRWSPYPYNKKTC